MTLIKQMIDWGSNYNERQRPSSYIKMNYDKPLNTLFFPWLKGKLVFSMISNLAKNAY